MPIIIKNIAGDSSVFHDISAALDNQLQTMASLPPVAWENKDFKPVKDALFLQPINLQGDTVASTATEDETVGVYNIGIYAAAGDGKNEVVTMSDLISDHFAQDSVLTYLQQDVTVRSVSRTTITKNDDGWLFASVNVVYYAFSARR